MRYVRGRKLGAVDHINVKVYNHVFSFLFQNSERFHGCRAGPATYLTNWISH